MMFRRGFTLIELSIVLVIIGLIVGGVMVGKEMIASATLRHAISDIDRLKTGISTFKLKYNCLPGDCANHGQFFTMSPLEYYGGNGNIPDGNGNGVYDTLGESEVRVFEALSLAGLITGTYTGQINGALTPGVNIPDYSWLRGAGNVSSNGSDTTLGVSIVYNYPCPADLCMESWQVPMVNNKTGKNRISIAAIYSSLKPGFYYASRGINCEFAHDLDMKIDDGMPATGTVVAYAMTGGNPGQNCLDWDINNGSPPATTTYVNDRANRSSPLGIDLGL